jgi:hypothetical protein
MTSVSTPQAAISRYMEARCRSQWPISIAEAVKIVREDLSDLDLHDDDLAEMVCIAAVQTGHAVSFDADLLRNPIGGRIGPSDGGEAGGTNRAESGGGH